MLWKWRMGKRRVLFVLAELLIITFFLTGAPVTASVTTIDNSTTIAGAIAAAAPGDTIILEPGIYFENEITIDRNITIRANTSYGHDASDTIIDALYLGRVFFNSAGNTLTIDNLTIQNTLRSYQGGAISNEGTLIVISSSFTRCTVSPDPWDYEAKGGAISNEGTLTVTGSTFTDCSAQTSPYMSTGGAIFNRGTATITSSVFNNCHSEEETYDIWGGAILNWWGCTLTVTSSEFNDCSAPGGGAIHVMGGTATIAGSTFSGCSATGDGGTIYAGAPGTVTIDTSGFTGNPSDYSANRGGAIFADGTTVSINSSTFSDFSATQGGTIFTNGGTCTITTTTFSGGWAGDDGGAIYNTGPLTIISSTFFGSGANMEGGAIENTGSLTVASSVFEDCRANNNGGAIDNSGGTADIAGSTITGCTASNNGGAISSSGPLTVTSSTFTGNAAGATGSALYSTESGSSVHFSRFYQNLHPVWGVVSSPTSLEAQNNWWGTSNTPPASGYVNYDPWLVLGTTASPASITMAQTATITANLTYDSDNGYHTPASGHVPDGIPVAFSLSGVSGTLGPLQGNVSAGANATVFTPASGGTAQITATVDGETVSIDIPVTGVVPAISSITPSSGMNTSPVSITDLHGTGFWTTGTTTVNLTRAGHANITTTTTALSTTQIACTLPITGAEAGAWDVVVTNPDGQEGVLTGGFTITAPVPTTVPTAAPTSAGQDTGETLSDFPSGGSVSPTPTQAGALPLMTVIVNIGGDSKAWQAIVTGTQLSGLIVTGTVQHDSGSNMTAPPGIVYQYISLVPARYTSITKAVINFTVPQAWLDENNIAPGSIVLYHQTANVWEALPTTVLFTKDGTVYFSAPTTAFSLFAIAGTPTAATPEVTATVPQGIMSAVVVQTPAPSAVAKAPVTTQTTAPPATAPQPAASPPLLSLVLVIAAIGILAGGGFMVRRWQIRRQNPAPFEEY